MARPGPLLAVAVVTLLASGCASAGGGGSCKFAYTDDFRTAIVQPELKRVFGAGWNNWKIEDPSIFEAHARAQILLHLRDEVNYLDPPEYKLVVDSCGRRLISAGKCYLPGTGAPEC